MSQSFINNKPNEFKHILRVLNTNQDGRRQAGIAITAIKGVGRRFATLACKKARTELLVNYIFIYYQFCYLYIYSYTSFVCSLDFEKYSFI